MPLPRFRRPREDPDPDVNAHTPLRPADWELPRRRSVTARQTIRQTLRRQLAILAARAQTREFDELAVQPILQVHVDHAGSYAAFRDGWARRFATAPGWNLSVDGWPTRLPENGWGVILVPAATDTTTLTGRLPPAARGASRGRRPGPRGPRLPLIANPLFAAAVDPRVIASSSPIDMGMQLLCDWFTWTPDHATAIAAPPIIEWVTADGSRVLKHELLTWELPWPLPVATPPADWPGA